MSEWHTFTGAGAVVVNDGTFFVAEPVDANVELRGGFHVHADVAVAKGGAHSYSFTT